MAAIRPIAVAARPSTRSLRWASSGTIEFEPDIVGDDYYAKTGGERFYVGTKTTSFRGGLRQEASLDLDPPKFRAADHKEALGHWAELLELTGYCESGNRMTCVNTYDRAGFTFGFYQLAAHTANDNLILFLRRLPELARATIYEPYLKLKNGKLIAETSSGVNDLEDTPARMRYFNPRQPEIDPEEFDWAARLMHWARHDPAMRALQIEVALAIMRRKVARSDKWYKLDGVSDLIVAVISDIHHQGRVDRNQVEAALALAPAKRLDALIDISKNHAARQKTLRARLSAAVKAGRMGKLVWSTAMQDFVDPNGKPPA